MKKINLKNIEFRQEQPKDYRETETLVRDAFWNQFQPGCVEHYLMHIMRDADVFIPELDVVAVYEGKIIGQIAYLENNIIDDNDVKHPVVGIGPICVATEYEGNGIGGALINYTKKIATKMGYPAVLLQGDPDYYSLNGFEPSKKYGIRTFDNKFAAAQQISVLSEFDFTGRYVESEVYQVDMNAVEEFDKTFPPKEKITGIRAQNKILKVIKMVEDYHN